MLSSDLPVPFRDYQLCKHQASAARVEQTLHSCPLHWKNRGNQITQIETQLKHIIEVTVWFLKMFSCRRELFGTFDPGPKWSVPAVPCSVHCRSTAAYAVYMQYRLLKHCWHTADCSVHDTASTWQCMCSAFAAYTANTLKLYCLYTPLRSGIPLGGYENGAVRVFSTKMELQ